MLKATQLLFTPICHKKISLHHPFTILNYPKRNPFSNSISLSLPNKNFKITAVNKQQFPELEPPNDDSDGENKLFTEKGSEEDVDFGWLPTFPHVLTASMSNFLFGYHIGVMNGPIVAIAKELGFEGNSYVEGLVVSIFIGGAFVGSLGCGSLVDKLGFRRTFQLDTIPLILGAITRRINGFSNLEGSNLGSIRSKWILGAFCTSL